MVSIKIERVTDPADIPILAHICELSLASDSFQRFINKYMSTSFKDETVQRFTTAISEDNQGMHAFKAVATFIDDTGAEVDKIVGCTLWYFGHLHIPKVDPFAVDRSGRAGEEERQTVADASVSDADGLRRADRAVLESASQEPRRNPHEELFRLTGNAYVSSVRGKRHVYLRRMAVLPEYQRQGIGTKLLQWGINLADHEKIVAWLFARPVASKLYGAAGWRTVAVTEINEQEFEVTPLISMLRLPKPWRGEEEDVK